MTTGTFSAWFTVSGPRISPSMGSSSICYHIWGSRNARPWRPTTVSGADITQSSYRRHINSPKTNYTFIYMNLYEPATLEITEILFIGCFFSFYEEVCLYFSGAYHQSSSSTIPTCRNIHVEFSFYEFIGIFK